MVVDSLCQGPADPLHSGQIGDTSLKNALQPSELAQQRATSLRSQAGNGFETGSPPDLCAALPVPGDRKAVCFIADLLNQVQG